MYCLEGLLAVRLCTLNSPGAAFDVLRTDRKRLECADITPAAIKQVANMIATRIRLRPDGFSALSSCDLAFFRIEFLTPLICVRTLRLHIRSQDVCGAS